jgi:glycosyltransferase involved in cell wall biosynthesis
LLEFFDKNAFEITILADDQPAIRPDPDNVQRLWSKRNQALTRVRDYLVANRFDAAFFQHDFSFFELDDFAETLSALSDAGINTFVTFHRTKDLEFPRRLVSQQQMTKALQSCTRIFVHSLADVNRLREVGVTGNVILLAHGVIDREPLNADAVRSLLGLSDFSPIIGSFGFLLPGKGLMELIHSFALILNSHPTAYLLMINAEFPTPESREQRERCLKLVRLLDIEGRVRLINEFLDVEEVLLLLSACDTIVYAYQRTEESVSGAVRLGLAAGRPVLVTPLPIFSDLGDIVYQLPGTEPRQIAEGIVSLLNDEHRMAEVLQRQREWVRANSWAAQAARISNIIHGCFEETRGVELRVPSPIGSRMTPSFKEAARTQIGSDSLRDADHSVAQKLNAIGVVNCKDGATATAGAAEVSNPPALVSEAVSRLEPMREGRKFLRGFGSWLPRSNPIRPAEAFISRADRARDSQDWVSAARYYRKALDQEPANPPIWVQYGHALKESGNAFEAENAYRKSLALEPNVADTHLQLGHALKIQGRRIEAGAAYVRALALDPGLDDASFELEGLGWSRGRIQLALRRERSRNQ